MFCGTTRKGALNYVFDCKGKYDFCIETEKRLTIALEMTTIVKPNLLCIDKPTTGLDSNVAEIVSKWIFNLLFLMRKFY